MRRSSQGFTLFYFHLVTMEFTKTMEIFFFLECSKLRYDHKLGNGTKLFYEPNFDSVPSNKIEQQKILLHN